jgi:hypothetical protein
MSKKKKEIRIIKVGFNNEDYTFVTDNNSNKTKTESTNNEKKAENRPNERVEKKIYSKKSHQKGRKILGKSLQGHSPVYE